MTRLKAYYVTHSARTVITRLVYAESAAEAVQKDAEQDFVESWADESWPTSKGRARRSPPDDPK